MKHIRSKFPVFSKYMMITQRGYFFEIEASTYGIVNLPLLKKSLEGLQLPLLYF